MNDLATALVVFVGLPTAALLARWWSRRRLSRRTRNRLPSHLGEEQRKDRTS